MNSLDIAQGDNLGTLQVRLTDVIRWCAQPGLPDNPALIFRSKELQPWLWARGRKDLISNVAQKRRRALYQYEEALTSDLAGGRLLWYAPDRNSSDGASFHESNGFFDIDNVPPWDIWIAYFHESEDLNYLVSWIPPTHLVLADQGVTSNVDICLGWLDELEGSIGAQALRDIGLIMH